MKNKITLLVVNTRKFQIFNKKKKKKKKKKNHKFMDINCFKIIK